MIGRCLVYVFIIEYSRFQAEEQDEDSCQYGYIRFGYSIRIPIHSYTFLLCVLDKNMIT